MCHPSNTACLSATGRQKIFVVSRCFYTNQAQKRKPYGEVVQNPHKVSEGRDEIPRMSKF